MQLTLSDLQLIKQYSPNVGQCPQGLFFWEVNCFMFVGYPSSPDALKGFCQFAQKNPQVLAAKAVFDPRMGWAVRHQEFLYGFFQTQLLAEQCFVQLWEAGEFRESS